MKKKGRTSIFIIIVAFVVLGGLFFIFKGNTGATPSGELAIPVDVDSIKSYTNVSATNSNDEENSEDIDNETGQSGSNNTQKAADSTGNTNTKEDNPENNETQDEAVTMDQIEVEVFNGTSVVGLASLTQADIERMGYTQVNAGNAPSQVTATSIKYSKDIPTELITQLETYLKEKFGEVASTPDQASGNNRKPQIVIMLSEPVEN